MKQIFLRHKNGGGRIYGNDALVAPGAFLDRVSSVGDNAEIYDGAKLIQSVAIDSALIANATLESSMVEGESRILGGFIYDSTLSGQFRSWGAPIIAHCSLRNVFVFGLADVSGFALDAFVRIHAGHWTKAPRYKVIRGEGIETTISECADDHAHIGCKCETFETWFRPGYRQRIGQVSGWAPSMVSETYDWFSTWKMSPAG